MKFDLDDVIVTEFGVGIDDGNEQTFVVVPVDAEVQTALHEMVQATWDVMQRDDTGPTRYQPSEKHGSIEYLYLPIGNDLAKGVRELHDATNLNIAVPGDPSNIFCYFTRLTDNKKRRLTALRRASQFKGVLKKRLIRVLDDTLKIIEDTVFKLDNDFDLLVDSANVHILRPSGFEFAGKLQEAILNAVPENMKSIQKDLPFVDLDGIEKYASKRPRAARYLASIRAQEETKNIDKAALKRLCECTGVDVNESKGKITVLEGHEMGFLEVLDRRRYEVSLVKDKPEHYLAGSRRKTNSSSVSSTS
ncbi:Kiwa anti-phage protein KwaB-like domain-containing protein [Thiolapillus sp.]|uniref:Kiwa anti-phage protein KwaB-like domain-containing protein n=6 Tax=Thiolapillus sp. TaxID=2017437 RepID=UPI002739DEE5|nr:Kiwa anti-phage protein KwaB-like domain-containing protein [Thiolapillus sp.]